MNIFDHFQVKNTKLLCSSYSENGAQLYKVERIDDEKSYTMSAIEPRDITVWMFDPNVESITLDLKTYISILKITQGFQTKSIG